MTSSRWFLALFATLIATISVMAWVMNRLADWGGLDNPQAWTVPETRWIVRKRTGPVL